MAKKIGKSRKTRVGAAKRPGAKTIKKNTNSTQNKSQTHRAKQYEVTSFLSTDCELSTETCSKNVYSLDPWTGGYGWRVVSDLYRQLRHRWVRFLRDTERDLSAQNLSLYSITIRLNFTTNSGIVTYRLVYSCSVMRHRFALGWVWGVHLGRASFV